MIHRTSTGQGPKPGGGINRGALVSVLIFRRVSVCVCVCLCVCMFASCGGGSGRSSSLMTAEGEEGGRVRSLLLPLPPFLCRWPFCDMRVVRVVCVHLACPVTNPASLYISVGIRHVTCRNTFAVRSGRYTVSGICSVCELHMAREAPSAPSRLELSACMAWHINHCQYNIF